MTNSVAYQTRQIKTHSRQRQGPDRKIEEFQHPPSAEDLVRNFMEEFNDNLEGVKKRFRSSCFETLDKSFPGWLRDGNLIIVAGRPGMGKSLFAQQIAESLSDYSNSDERRSTLYFNLEMSNQDLAIRSISRRSKIPVAKIMTFSSETIKSEDLSSISEAAREFRKASFFAIENINDIAGIINESRKLNKYLEDENNQHIPKLACIIVDYLQIVRADKRGPLANRTQEVGLVSAELKRLAKELSVPIIAISALNRGTENRQDKKPGLSDLRDSGNVEQDADLVLFLYRDDYYNSASKNKGTIELIAAKSRHSASGTITLNYESEYGLFSDVAE